MCVKKFDPYQFYKIVFLGKRFNLEIEKSNLKKAQHRHFLGKKYLVDQKNLMREMVIFFEIWHLPVAAKNEQKPQKKIAYFFT